MTRDELGSWLRLTLTAGVGNSTARKLLASFGMPQSIFQQSTATLAQVVSLAQAQALSQTPLELPQLLDVTWNWLQAGTENPHEPEWRCVATLGDSAYPASLLDMEDPPLLLYMRGARHWLRAEHTPGQATQEIAQTLLHHSLSRGIAVVGSRNPTPQGLINARDFAHSLCQAGLTVVSGLALGVDGAAHDGALAGLGEKPSHLGTIAVVGTGLDRVYPQAHRELAHRIVEHGLIISEYALGTPPVASNFPKRNRLIAGLTQGTLVVEAALKSGSLITARLAAEQGKDVFAIPGSIHAVQSKGCHALIKQGAKLVECTQDVLEESGFPQAPVHVAVPEVPSPASTPLLAALGHDPVGLDALQARTGMDTAQLQVELMTLELEGHVGRLHGGLFQRLART